MDEFLTNGHFDTIMNFHQTIYLKEDNLIISFFTTFTAIETEENLKRKLN